MPSVTYLIRFYRHSVAHSGNFRCEEHLSLADAWNAVKEAMQPDVNDQYVRICLVEYNWEQLTEKPIAAIELFDRY